MSASGELLFARYAYAPNELGYCGPADAQALFDLGVTGQTNADITDIARRFSGAWPYAVLLAQLAGIDDPLDETIMRAYWTGGALDVDRDAFATTLFDYIRQQAGRYWAHLTPDLVDEVSPTHAFHVFGVYPWSRLLVGDTTGQPLRVLDNCRIRAGQVTGWDDTHVTVVSRRLTWDGAQLGLAEPAEERVRRTVDGKGFVLPRKGDWLALHWDWVCDRLDPEQRDDLERSTRETLEATNRRLANASARATETASAR